jgi:short subunit dehydrogenase-like uncharacterized protein
MHIKYHDKAVAQGVTIVSCCGFDCVPAEMGTVFTKQVMRQRGWTPAVRRRERLM